MVFLPPRTDVYPYLLVNIGSGVSMIKVSGPREYARIGGTSLGGGTLWGLLSLITGARSFDAMLALAEQGDNTAVDMLVGDIYGTGYSKIGLKSDTIASSFGKVYKMKKQAEREAEDGGGLLNGDADPMGDGSSTRAFRPEDVSRSLLYAVRYVAVLISCRIRPLDLFERFAATILVRLRTFNRRNTSLSTFTSAARSSGVTGKR